MRMSFHDGTLNRKRAEEIIADTTLPILYSVGFAWQNPTYVIPIITKEKAYEIIRNEPLLDIDFADDYICLNVYHENDMR